MNIYYEFLKVSYLIIEGQYELFRINNELYNNLIDDITNRPI